MENRAGKGGLVHKVNRIQNLYPKDSRGIVKWMLDNQLLYADRQKAPQWLAGLLSSGPVDEYSANSKPDSTKVLEATKVVRTFKNIKVSVTPNLVVTQLASTIAQAFPGVEIVTDPAAREQALAESGALALLDERRPLLLAETQLETYGEASHVVVGPPLPTQLYKANPDGSRTRWPKGTAYYDAESDTTQYLLFDAAGLDALRNRFSQGTGYSGEVETFQTLRDFYNQAEVVKLLEEENGFLRPDQAFERVVDYYPIRTVNSSQDARTKSRGFSRTLDESRQLVNRQSASNAVLLRDPITTMGD
ncbi:hypothetical protein CLV58_113120 [Spirosoma oryzae]|uniref:Uncharacterized protein n=1 Tax=Spirosoma oryzae TaxID=1469603 RepID=A0A2T0SRF7_9BACT|nr:hypothetical protein [Spirosoma oryzae]PRY35989.1 hypothetical protein CLV58_113120 [Spirosoma oryzae]